MLPKNSHNFEMSSRKKQREETTRSSRLHREFQPYTIESQGGTYQPSYLDSIIKRSTYKHNSSIVSVNRNLTHNGQQYILFHSEVIATEVSSFYVSVGDNSTEEELDAFVRTVTDWSDADAKKKMEVIKIMLLKAVWSEEVDDWSTGEVSHGVVTFPADMRKEEYGYVSMDEVVKLLGEKTAKNVVAIHAVLVAPKHYGICEGILWVTNFVEGFELGGRMIKCERSEENASKVAHSTVRIVVHEVMYNAFTIRRSLKQK